MANFENGKVLLIYLVDGTIVWQYAIGHTTVDITTAQAVDFIEAGVGVIVVREPEPALLSKSKNV